MVDLLDPNKITWIFLKNLIHQMLSMSPAVFTVPGKAKPEIHGHHCYLRHISFNGM